MTALTKVLLVAWLPAILALRPANMPKCCNNDEVLTADLKCSKNETSSWDLKIFNGRKGKMEKHTSLPQHWRIQENARPNCVRPVKFLYENRDNFFFMNGSLFSVDYDRLFHPNQFCMDYGAALVCIEPQLMSYVIVKKCCGQEAIYSQTNHSCIHFKGDSYQIDIGQDKAFGAGFPPCTDRMQVVAQFHESKIQSNGSLLVNDKILLPAGNYCLEHVLEHTGGLAGRI